VVVDDYYLFYGVGCGIFVMHKNILRGSYLENHTNKTKPDRVTFTSGIIKQDADLIHIEHTLNNLGNYCTQLYPNYSRHSHY
jgi:hypothetical protein